MNRKYGVASRYVVSAMLYTGPRSHPHRRRYTIRMVKVASGVVAVGAGLWLVSGALYFSHHSERIADLAPAQGQYTTQVASAAWFTDLFSDFQSFLLAFFGVGGRSASPVALFDGGEARKGALAGELSCTIEVNPVTVAHDGSAILSWSSRGADKAELHDHGQVALDGMKKLEHITSTQAIALIVYAGERSHTCYTVVNVEPHIVKAPSCVISAHPSEVQAGESVALSWGSEGADSATIEPFGSVALQGGNEVAPDSSTTYSMTVLGGDKEAKCSTRVLVR